MGVGGGVCGDLGKGGKSWGWFHGNKKGMIRKGGRAWLWKGGEGGGMEDLKERISFFFSAVRSCFALIFMLTNMQLSHTDAQ